VLSTHYLFFCGATAQVFSRAELEHIASLCLKFGVYALSDEVYEHLVLPPAAHVSLRALPGMADRCLRLGSAGKTFSFTAWKVGWVTGPAAVRFVPPAVLQIVQ
jgi:aspartate/methionine/tyrosine aminotransferase